MGTKTLTEALLDSADHGFYVDVGTSAVVLSFVDGQNEVPVLCKIADDIEGAARDVLAVADAHTRTARNGEDFAHGLIIAARVLTSIARGARDEALRLEAGS